MISQLPPRRENICAILVTYNPDVRLPARATQIARQVAHLLLVDNRSDRLALPILRAAATAPNAHLVRNNVNFGIATALNQGIRWALDRGYQWALTLDQDTMVADDMVATLSNVYAEYPKNGTLAIIGVNYKDPNSDRLFFRANRDHHNSWEEVKTVITSGSLVSLAVYSTIGPFREEFFIDCVDLEYCLRARAHGFKVVLAREPLMQHAIGAATLHKLPWKMTGTSNHAPARRYYMTRNHLVLVREYLRKEPVWAFSTLYSRLKSTVLMCLFEKDRVCKLKYTATGAFDGVLSKFDRKMH